MNYNYGTISFFQLIFVMIFSTIVIALYGKKCNFSFKKVISERRTSNLIIFVLFILDILLLVFLSAFREIGEYGTHIGGYDAYSYREYFMGRLGTTHFEPGYVLLTRIIRIFTNNFSVFLIIVSLLMIYCMIKYLKKSQNNSIFLIFLLLCLYFSSFNTLRASIAIFIFLLVLLQLKDEKYLKATFLGLLAVSIHVSSLIIFPVILFNYLFKPSKKISYVKIISLVLFLSVLSFLVAYYSANYLTSTSYESYVGNGQIVINVYLFAAFIFYLSIKNYSNLVKDNMLNKVLIISLPIVFLIFPMQLIMVIMYRMVEFFLPIMYTIMTQIYKINNKIMIKCLIVILFIYKIVDFFLNCKYIGILE